MCQVLILGIVRRDGRQRGFKLVGSARRGVFWGLGLISESLFSLYLEVQPERWLTSSPPFPRDQSEEGPCGPTAFWKVANAYDENSDGEVVDEDELNDGDWVQGNDDEDDGLQEEGEEVEVEQGGIVSGGQIIFYTIQHTEEVMEDEDDDDDGWVDL